MATWKRIALTLVIIGALNWGLIGLFQFDLVATIFGGQEAVLSRIVYSLVGISGLLCLTLLFDPMEEEATNRINSVQTGAMSHGTEFGEETNFSNRDKKNDQDINKKQ